MRILYLSDRLSHRGGAPLHLLDIIHAAPGERRVITGKMDPDIQLDPNIHVETIPGLNNNKNNSPDLSVLHRALQTADVVHVQNVMIPSVIKAAVETGVAIVTVQDHRVFCPGPGRTLPDDTACTQPMSDIACGTCLPDTPYRTRMLATTAARKEALAGATLVVLSRYMAQELSKAGLPGAHIIPPPVSAASSPGEPGSGFLMASRLVQHKGVDWAVDAWRRSTTDHPLKVAGTGRLSNGLPPGVALGWVSRATLRETMRDARALLFPSRWQEPFGISAVEALAEGTPVICMNTGGTPDWHDQGCIVVPPGDVDAMADAIRRLTESPATASTLGLAGWEMVRERFGPEHALEPLWKLYAAVAASA